MPSTTADLKSLRDVLANTDAIPENFNGGGVTPGFRDVVLCPEYFTFKTSTRGFPYTPLDITAWCIRAFAEGNTYSGFVTGGKLGKHNTRCD